MAPVVTDEELARLALAADPDVTLPDGAVPWDGAAPAPLLPDWYMPAPVSGGRLRGWRRTVVLLLVLAFVIIEAYGLCSTFGRPGG